MRELLIVLIYSTSVFAQNKYSVDSIPAELRQNADAVIRTETIEFTIEDVGNAVLSVHKVITVFNERGAREYSKFYTYYDKLTKVRKISGAVYDRNGSKVFKLKNKDVVDVSLSSLSNDVTDGRQKITEFDSKSFQYPYTIEFSSTVKVNNMMFYPAETFYSNKNVSVQEKSLIINTPADFVFRYKEQNMPQKVYVKEEGRCKKYIWNVRNMPAFEYEPFSNINEDPSVVCAPKAFEIESYKGEINSWNDIGKFVYTLNAGRDVLPERVKKKVHELIGNEKETLKKIQLLYGYLQNNTRYLSIQLGIGGWQTMSAIDVSSKGYGDCKALSNYMKALLSEAGIASCVALVMAGDNADEVDSDFPSMRFNHSINCIPLERDTIWLECTSQTNPMGYQGSFTGNRKALLILPEGGVLVNTIKYGSFDNSKNRKAKIVIDELGNAKAQIKTFFSGIQHESKSYILHEKDQEQQKRLVRNSIKIPSFDLEKFSFVETKSQNPSIEESLELRAHKILKKTGTRIFIKPNLLGDNTVFLPETKERKHSLFLSPNIFNSFDSDSILIYFQENISPEFIPEPVFIKSKFGEYSVSISFQKGTLVYYRRLILNGGNFPAEDYKDFFDFLKFIDKNDRIELSFMEKVNK